MGSSVSGVLFSSSLVQLDRNGGISLQGGRVTGLSVRSHVVSSHLSSPSSVLAVADFVSAALHVEHLSTHRTPRLKARASKLISAVPRRT
jgi:hypothetical protein